MQIDQIRNEFRNAESSIADGPIVPNVTAGEIRAYLGSRFDFTKAMPLEDVVADVEKMLRAWQVQVTHPRYFGLFNPSVTLASVVADTLAAMYNSQLANWRTAPGANEMERHTLAWLAERFGFPADTIGTFASGGSEANFSAVVVALTWAFPEYGERGLRHLDGEPAIYLTEEAHQGFNKIAHMAGLGRRNLRIVATDANLKMNVDDLRRCVAADRREGRLPFMVIGTGGTTTAGVIDPLSEIGQIAKEQGLWFHADAAYGGSAVVSPRLRPHLAGIELADSITCDAHKWLSVPMGCGIFLCRHRDSVAQAFRADVTYLSLNPDAEDATITFNPLTHSPQWSRRFIGLKLFMALAERGEAGYAGDAGTPGGDGRYDARDAHGQWMADHEFHAASGNLFRARWAGCPETDRGTAGKADCVDVGCGHRRRSDSTGVHYKFQNHRARDWMGGWRDEQACVRCASSQDGMKKTADRATACGNVEAKD